MRNFQMMWEIIMGLRIGITRREYLTNLDGVNRFLFTLADGLSVLGHEMSVISYSFAGGPFSDLIANLQKYFDFEGNAKIYTLTTSTQRIMYPKIALTWCVQGSKLIDKLD